MLSLLLSLFLLLPPSQPAPAADACAPVAAAADSLYRAVWRNWIAAMTQPDPGRRDALLRLASLAQEARRCYGARATEQIKETYSWEIYALFALHRFDMAFDRFDQFFTRFAAAPDSAWFTFLYRFRGFIHGESGRLGEALGDFGRALTYAASGPLDQRAELCLDFGHYAQRARDYPAAWFYYDRAEQLLRTKEGPPEMEELLARALHLKADLLVEQEHFTSAQDSAALTQAAALAEESFRLYAGRSSYNVGPLILLSEIQAHRGRTEAAFTYLQQAERLSRRSDDPNMPGLLALKRARLHMLVRDFDRAEAALSRADSLIRSAGYFDYPRRLLQDRGFFHELRGDYAAAEAAYRQAIRLIDRHAAALGVTEWGAVAFSYWQQESHRALVRVLLAQGRHEEAFLTLEGSRARYLQGLRTQARSLHMLAPADRARYDRLSAALIAVRNRLAGGAGDMEQRIALMNEEAQLTADRAALLKTGPAASAVSIAELRKTLAARGRTLLSYFIDREDALFGRPARPTAFVLTKDTLMAIPLPGATESSVRTRIADVSPILASGEGDLSLNQTQFSLSALHRLYRLLYAPLAAHVPAGSPLTVLPDGPLFLLPFGLLVAREVRPYAYREAPYLLRRHTITTELAASLLVDHAPAPERRSPDLAIFGKTEFGGLSEAAVEPFRGPAPLLFRGAALSNLPAVADEVEAVRSLFWDVRVALDGQATKSAFLDFSNPPKILHVASHALVSPTSPLHNAIILSAADSGAAQEGLLYLHELQGRRLASDLVVLSGCSTARGALRTGEGMAGLQHAFRAMGVASTLSTLWLVEDRAMVPLTAAFYRNLRRGLPRDAALQQAQIAFLEQAGEAVASPFFWAAPVLYGHTDPIPLTGKYAGLPAPAWIALGLAVLLGILLRARRLLQARRFAHPAFMPEAGRHPALP